jgi:hypothetical protein
MTRYQFEALLEGDWEKIDNDRLRKNGKFSTFIRGPWKYLSDGTNMLRAKSWHEISEILAGSK